MFGKMTRPLQVELSERVLLELETFKATHALEPQQICYWLVSFAWGYLRRLGWDNLRIGSYALTTFEACDRLSREATSHGDIALPHRQPR